MGRISDPSRVDHLKCQAPCQLKVPGTFRRIVRSSPLKSIALILFLAASVAWAQPKACPGHGGVVGCVSEGHALCKDGSVDKRFECSEVKSTKKPKRTLKFKPATNRGQ